MKFIYTPSDYYFEWTDDGYKWDRDKAYRKARRARQVHAQKLKAAGKKKKQFVLRNRIITKGGNETGHPEIEIVCHRYVLVETEIEVEKRPLTEEELIALKKFEAERERRRKLFEAEYYTERWNDDD